MDEEVAAIVAASQAELCLRIRSRAAANDHGAHGMADQETRNASRRRARRGFSGKEITSAGEAHAGGVQECQRKDVRFFEAEDLFAQGEDIGAKWVERSGSHVATIVGGVNGGERIALGKYVIKTGGAKVFANGLQRTAKNLRNAVEVLGARVRCWPQIQKRHHARSSARARRQAGDKCDRGLVQVLAEALVIGEEESFVRPDGGTQRGSELVALKGRSSALVKEIWRIESVVAEELKR